MFGAIRPHSKIGNMKNTGFTIIEILIVIAVITTALAAILGFFAFESQVAERSRMRLEAISLAEETIEAVRNFRDNTTWATTGVGKFTIDADYHPASSSAGWNIVSGNETINGFTRKIIFSKVYRYTTNDNISDSGTEDSNTRKITVTVSWTDRQGAENESLITYITNWKN